MLKDYRNWISVVLLAAVVAGISACSTATPAAPTPSTDALITQAAETVAAQFTQTAAAAPQATSTTAPTNTIAPATPTAPAAQPTQPAPAVTNTIAPANPNQPAAAADDKATFVADVTVPDGTGAVPGATFVKTWRIKNTGKTTWTAAYSLVFIDGERMNAPDKINMPNEVRPDETVDLTVTLTAPTKAGSYQAFYRLRNAAGQYFRLDGTGDLWVKIAVGSGATVTPVPSVTPGGETSTPAATKPASDKP